MNFFTVTQDSPGLFPVLGNAKYIWIYAVATSVVCITVFGWWYYKHRTFLNPKGGETGGDAKSESPDAKTFGSETNEVLRRKEHAREIGLEALAEYEELHATGPPDGDEDAIKAWHKRNSVVHMKLLSAHRAIETGEKFENIYPHDD